MSSKEFINPLNGQTHSNNSSDELSDKLFECVWLFCGVGTLRFNFHISKFPNLISEQLLREKCSYIRSFTGPYFPALRLNMEKYLIALRIQSKCEKMRIRKTPNTDTFLLVNYFPKHFWTVAYNVLTKVI